MSEWHMMLNDRMLYKFWIKEGETLTIGRSKEADVTIDNSAVSRRHTSLSMRNGKHFVSDLGSSNGTIVNGVKIDDTVPVTETDRIEIGKFRFVLVPPRSTPIDIDVTFLTPPKEKPEHKPGK